LLWSFVLPNNWKALIWPFAVIMVILFVNIHHAGHVCASVCLFIGRISHNVMDKLSSKLSGTNCGENLTCCALWGKYCSGESHCWKFHVTWYQFYSHRRFFCGIIFHQHH